MLKYYYEGDFMNRKGFTLVEVLAVVVILSIIGLLSFRGVINVINKSRDSGEVVFKNNLDKAIRNYIVNGNISSCDSSLYQFDKVYNDSYRSSKSSELFSCGSITFSDIISAKYLGENDLVNPKNDKKCNLNTSILIYRDSEYVYYYSFDDSVCNIAVNNLPEETSSDISSDDEE